jgi:colanic acid/amylovoran biosynthesis glycosyltransferase
MAKADIYLQPSVQEGFCNAVLEAQAQGCLCLVSDAEGLGENIEPGVTGYQFARRGVGELSELLARALAMTEEEKGPLRLAARSRVERHFTMPRQLDLFRDFYGESSRA